MTGTRRWRVCLHSHSRNSECVLLPTHDRTELSERLKASLENAGEFVVESQYIEKLLEDTDESLLLPPEHERKKASGQKDDWNQIEDDTLLVGQRLLKSYQRKRQGLRSGKCANVTDPGFALRAEHQGYRRFTPYGLNKDREIAEINTNLMSNKILTDETRQIDPCSLVCQIAIFPPRQKGVIARQSSEMKVIHTTKLTDVFATGLKYISSTLVKICANPIDIACYKNVIEA